MAGLVLVFLGVPFWWLLIFYGASPERVDCLRQTCEDRLQLAIVVSYSQFYFWFFRLSTFFNLPRTWWYRPKMKCGQGGRDFYYMNLGLSPDPADRRDYCNHSCSRLLGITDGQKAIPTWQASLLMLQWDRQCPHSNIGTLSAPQVFREEVKIDAFSYQNADSCTEAQIGPARENKQRAGERGCSLSCSWRTGD